MQVDFIPSPFLSCPDLFSTVRFLSLKVESGFQSFDLAMLHPLSHLSAVREKLVLESPDSPLDNYWFTLDGKSRLKETLRLWDLGITTSSVIHLRNAHSPSNNLMHINPDFGV
jgi:hypothetical protein